MSKINYHSFTFYVQTQYIKIEFREAAKKATLRKIEVSYSEFEGKVEVCHFSALERHHIMIDWSDELYMDISGRAIEHYLANIESNRSNATPIFDFNID